VNVSLDQRQHVNEQMNICVIKSGRKLNNISGPILSTWLGGYSRLWHRVVVPARQLGIGLSY
jgi:hypothetical protein